MDLKGKSNKNLIFPSDLLSLNVSLGYDCQRLYNLAVLDDPQGTILVYATGRFLHFYNTTTGKLIIKNSSSYGGIGHFAAHPSKPYIAVGEKGFDNPPITVFSWPTQATHIKFQGGAARGYSYLRFSCDGNQLASLSLAPDSLLTLWDWKTGHVVLQSHAADADVWYLAFSDFSPDLLASCGISHVKLWRMSQTFTGLKLQGELGSFGGTETCDITSVLVLPNGSCATGSLWGNLLLWEERRVRLQVCRVAQRPCHDGAVTHVLFYNGNLLSAGMDGVIRVWDYEAITLTEASQGSGKVELEPTFELNVQEGANTAQLLSLAKLSGHSSQTVWFAQDGAGAVWSVDLSMSLHAQPPRRLFISHAGAVVGVQAAPQTPVLVTLGADSRLMVWDIVKDQLIVSRQFNAPGTCLYWLPITVAENSCTLTAGFADGVIRMLQVTADSVVVAQVLRPHTNAVVSMALSYDYLVTISDDCSVFVFTLERKHVALVLLKALGYWQTPNVPTTVLWKNDFTFFVGFANGRLWEFKIASRTNTNLETYLVNWPCRQVDIGVPHDFGPIRWMWMSSNVLYLGSEMGFLYRCKQKAELICSFPSAILCHYYWSHKNCLLLGRKDGCISAISLDENKDDIAIWTCGVHDINRGAVRQLSVSRDGRRLFSCAEDGGIFGYCLHGTDTFANFQTGVSPLVDKFQAIGLVDADDSPSLSLEQTLRKANIDNRRSLAEQQKKKRLNAILQLRTEYQNMLKKNEELPEELRLKGEDFLVDNRVRNSPPTEENNHDKKLLWLAERSNLIMKRLTTYLMEPINTPRIAVEGIQSSLCVETFRLRKLGKDFHADIDCVRAKLKQMEMQGSAETTPKPPEVVPVSRPESPDQIKMLIKQVSELGDVARSRKLAALYRQHRARRAAAAERARAYDELMRQEPDPVRFDPINQAALARAMESLGNLQLKNSPDYKVPSHRNVTALSKYAALLETHFQIHQLRDAFNQQVSALQDRREAILTGHAKCHETLAKMTKCSHEVLISHPGSKPNEEPCQNLTEWEREKIQAVIRKNQQVQVEITARMNEDIKEFDKAIEKLFEDRINVEVDTKFLQIHLLTLHREVLVLKRFETDEKERLDNVFVLVQEKQNLQNRMQETTALMENGLRRLDTIQEEIATLVASFYATIAQNKYSEFFKRIFKKKFKEKKIKNEESDSDDSDFDSDWGSDSSGSSMAEDNGEYVKLHESVCPNDCDRDVYESVFRTRAIRHQLEFTYNGKKKEVEYLQKSFISLRKALSQVEINLTKAEKSVEELQRKKQSELDKVEILILLKLNQIESLHKEDVLVIDRQTLSQLYNRVGELTRETSQQRERHQHNRQHLLRIVQDLRYMEEQMCQLEDQIKEATLCKFGTQVDIDQLEESMVKKLVAEIGMIPMKLQNKLEHELLVQKKELEERVDMYAARLSENTKRCNILSVLKDENLKLEDILEKQAHKKQKNQQGTHEDVDELQDLIASVREQEARVAKLREEVSYMKLKTSALPKFTILGPDGRCHNISLTMRDRIQDLAAQIEQLVPGIQCEDAADDTQVRLKTVVEALMDAVPEEVLRAVWQTLGDLELALSNKNTLIKAADMAIQIAHSICHHLPPP